jgi:glutathione S-transferase
MTKEAVLLFGAPVGLYTGKIRSYLRKQGIPFQERLPSDPLFQSQIQKAVQRFINPVIRMPDGSIVQDTADIIDYLEANGHAAFSVYPEPSCQHLVALALDLFGGEGLVRAAMHYRWSYRTENEAFLRHEFGLSFRAAGMVQADIDLQLDGFMDYLNAYLPKLGITAASTNAVEAAYEDLLAALDAHLRQHPYLLGGRPTVADFGFIANLFAHLGRDPYPSHQMKLTAPSVFRWTERMMACDPDTPEFPDYPTTLPAKDGLPESLMPVLQCMAQDYLPELRMVVQYSDRWLSEQGEIAANTPVTAKPSLRSLGSGTFTLRGVDCNTMVQPYTLYKLQRITDAFADLSLADQSSALAYFEQAGLQDLLTLRATRKVTRLNHIEVWA